MDIDKIKNCYQKWNSSIASDIYEEFNRYYMPFNLLYDEYLKEIKNNNEYSNDINDLKKIRNIVSYLKENDDTFNKFIINKEYNNTIEKKVIDLKTGKPSTFYERKNLKKGKIKDCLCFVYAIRCNLVHGGKLPDSLRDRDLVTIALDILKQFFQKYFELESKNN